MNAYKLEQWAFRLGAVLLGLVVVCVFLPAAKAYPKLLLYLLGPALFFAGYWMASRGVRIARTGQLVVTSIFTETQVPSFIARLYGVTHVLLGALGVIMGLVMSLAFFF